MKKMVIVFLCLLSTAFAVLGQTAVGGKVSNARTGEPLPGVNIMIKGTNSGTATDTEGRYRLNALAGSFLVFTFIGFDTEEMEIMGPQDDLDVAMIEDIATLMDVVVVGSRFNPRTTTNSPVPIDNFKSSELRSSGMMETDQMLMFAAPSFNSSNQTVSDATAHVNPADLRGLAPSRTLVLINGKKKNQSALVYINDTPGKGEVGVDLKGIPMAAVKKVEILRDGASAQYGSDAIAGVINFVLKDDAGYGEINTLAGIHTKGDGAAVQTEVNYGMGLKQGGFINVSGNFSHQGHTNRPGDFTGKDSQIGLVDVSPALLAKFPHAGMTVGQPEMLTNNVFYNASVPVGENGQFYSFGGITLRKGRSFALYRLPTWSAIFADPYGIQGPDGFQPDFQTDIIDKTFSAGLKGEKNGWNFDLSATYGANGIAYNVNNSVNPSMGLNSPTSFDAGGHAFSQIVNNLDLSKKSEKFGFAAGGEFRMENFQARAGEESSYLGGGAQSFPGFQPSNEVNKFRYNTAVYAEGEVKTGGFLAAAAARYEHYSDFGGKLTGKISARYLFMDDKMTLRASANTGFRAPSLHQVYFSNKQTIIIGGRLTEQGTFNNQSPILRAFGVPKLHEETSINFSAGAAYAPNTQFSITADYYDIKIDDRIVFTGNISNADTNTVIGKILSDYSIRGLKFFTNAIDTRTRGLDVVLSYDELELGPGKLNLSLAANFNKTEIVGDLKTPALLSKEGNALFDRKERARIETARPRDKMVAGISYKIGKMNFVLNNTRFGTVTWRHQTDAANDQTFSAKIVTDLNVDCQLTEKLRLSAGANNLFDIYPDAIDPKNDPSTNLIGRFKYPWEVNQFGFNGRFVYLKMNFKIE